MANEIEDDDELINTFEKFVRHERLTDWPATFEEDLKVSSQFISYTSSRQIFDYFKQRVPFPVDIPISFSKSIEELWSKIKQHESTMSQAQSKETDSTLVDENKYNAYVENAHRKMKEQSETVSRSLDIKDYDYPGFSAVEDTDIPGHPDALQHLDNVSKAQSFNPGFLKIWRPFFTSDLSLAVLKDTFWWFFLHKFKPNEEEENKLFDRIAEAFVSLLMTEMDLKDKLFKVYPDCLAQAVCSAFYGAFPGSMERLDDNFKRDLANLITHWASGVKPNLFSWRNWDLGWVNPPGDTDEESEAACDLQMEFEELMSHARRLSLGQPLSPVARRGSIASADARMDRKRESHYIGVGPEFQHVLFKPCAPSPLVLRYLQVHGIPIPAGSNTRRIRRTEIVSLPYQEVQSEAEEKSQQRQQAYNTFCQQNKQEIVDIQRERIFNNMELDRMKKEIFSNPTELKIVSEGIMNKWDCPPYRQHLRKGDGRGKQQAEVAKNAEQPSVSPEDGQTGGQ